MEAGRTLPNTSTGDVYEVEKIIKKRHHRTKGDLYLVKWKHFPTSDNTWEPACNFPRELIDDFELSHKKKKQKIQPMKVFNPISNQSPLPVVEEVIYQPDLTKEPIMVTDVTARDMTITISECKTKEGFFSA